MVSGADPAVLLRDAIESRPHVLSLNADRLTPDALQALMRHRNYSTTQVYINTARQIDEAVAGLYVPEVLRRFNG